jgi:hypothetical protein
VSRRSGMAGSSTALSWGVPNATAETFAKAQACFEAEGFELLRHGRQSRSGQQSSGASPGGDEVASSINSGWPCLYSRRMIVLVRGVRYPDEPERRRPRLTRLRDSRARPGPSAVHE